jgi:catechol 2,3-dioxygenase-like lactoylglutathione lyase family enzyme
VPGAPSGAGTPQPGALPSSKHPCPDVHTARRNPSAPLQVKIPRGNNSSVESGLGIRCVAFAVDDIDAAVAGLPARGAEFVGGVERYEDSYRLCYVRGPEGIIVMLAEQIG